MALRLFADPECQKFAEQHPDEFSTYGCGPGGLGDVLVPDTVWGLSIRDACRIHDWGYRHSPDSSEDSRKRHDNIFKNNALRIVAYHTKSGMMMMLRQHRVKVYYQMVRFFGATAYWSDRNDSSQLMEV